LPNGRIGIAAPRRSGRKSEAAQGIRSRRCRRRCFRRRLNTWVQPSVVGPPTQVLAARGGFLGRDPVLRVGRRMHSAGHPCDGGDNENARRVGPRLGSYEPDVSVDLAWPPCRVAGRNSAVLAKRRSGATPSAHRALGCRRATRVRGLKPRRRRLLFYEGVACAYRSMGEGYNP
jgi:hypothetical protein